MGAPKGKTRPRRKVAVEDRLGGEKAGEREGRFMIRVVRIVQVW